MNCVRRLGAACFVGMAEIVNLRQARKAKARAAKEGRAVENRARHGATRAEKVVRETEAARAAALLDGARLEGEAP